MGSYILAIDQGTTSCRAIVYDENLETVAVAQQEFQQYYPNPGWVEHDAEEIWSVQESMIKEAVRKANISSSDIQSIGITNQRETVVVWDKTTGKPYTKAIVWQDRRTANICKELKERGYPDLFKNKTGLVLDAYFSGTKIKWLLDNVPNLRDEVEKDNVAVGTMDSWLLWKLTKGEAHVTDPSNASRTLLFDINHLSWDEELAGILDVPLKILPEVKLNDEVFGHYELEGRNIPIRSVLGDQQAALFGQLCWEPGDVKNTYGTGCFMLLQTGEKAVASQNNLLTTVAWQTRDRASYALEGSIFIAGAAVQWLRDGLKIIEKAEETELMATNADEKQNVIFVPAFVGLGAPYWDMEARGAIFGLTRDTGREEICRAVLDSLAFQTKDLIAAMEADAGVDLNALKVDGGAIRNNYLMQSIADIIDTSVVRPSDVESTARGVAMMAGLNIGLWKTEELKDLMKVDRVFESNMSSERRSRKYDFWKKGVQRSMNWEKS